MKTSLTLDELVLAAAEKGLTHLSLSSTPSADGKKVYWRATACPSTAHHYVNTASTNPLEALTAVLLALPKAPKRRPPASRTAGKPITAAVIEEEEKNDG